MRYGLVHRIERLNAFIPCGDAGHHAHDAQFLICHGCGTVAELDDQGVVDALRRLAEQRGFKPRHATIEVEGTCAKCASRTPRSGQAVLDGLP